MSKFSGSVFKNCVGFCSSFLRKVLLGLDWHSMALAQLFPLLGISSCCGILWSQHLLAVLNNWDYKGTEYLLHQATSMFGGRPVCILLGDWWKKCLRCHQARLGTLKDCVVLFLVSLYLLFPVQWTFIVSMCKTLSCPIECHSVVFTGDYYEDIFKVLNL